MIDTLSPWYAWRWTQWCPAERINSSVLKKLVSTAATHWRRCSLLPSFQSFVRGLWFPWVQLKLLVVSWFLESKYTYFSVICLNLFWAGTDLFMCQSRWAFNFQLVFLIIGSCDTTAEARVGQMAWWVSTQFAKMQGVVCCSSEIHSWQPCLLLCHLLLCHGSPISTLLSSVMPISTQNWHTYVSEFMYY